MAARARADVQAERLDVAAQGAAAAVVELHRHQARRELDDGGPQTQQAQGVRRLQAEQPAADDDARPRRRHAQARMPVEVVERAVDERAPAASVPAIGGTNGAEPVASTHVRYAIVRPAAVVAACAAGSSDDDRVAEHQLHARRVVEVGLAERQLLGVVPSKTAERCTRS